MLFFGVVFFTEVNYKFPLLLVEGVQYVGVENEPKDAFAGIFERVCYVSIVLFWKERM